MSIIENAIPSYRGLRNIGTLPGSRLCPSIPGFLNISQRSCHADRQDRKANRDAHRLVMPALLWVVAWVWYKMMDTLATIAPRMHMVGIIGAVFLSVLSLIFLPRSIRLIRNFPDSVE